MQTGGGEGGTGLGNLVRPPYIFKKSRCIMIDLTGRTALITGGSRGIGAATAILFARAGADVAVVFNKSEREAGRICTEIERLGRRSIRLKGDVSKTTDCARIVVKMRRTLGRIDLLVNSAGIWENGPIGTMSRARWERTIDINLSGSYNVIRHVVPVMKRQKYGRIINVASTAGQRGESLHSHYAASKGGIIALTKSLAVELIGSGIWVNCVSPGWVDTDMVKNQLGNRITRKSIFQSIPRGRAASPEEIAGPILFLASDLSNHIVGAIIPVNGGSVLSG